MASALHHDWPMGMGDVGTAFLHAPLPSNQVVYVKVPKMEETEWPGGYIRLRQALYGLRNSPKLFQHYLANSLSKTGWKRHRSELQLFLHQSGAMLSIYADDLLYSGPQSAIAQIQASIERHVLVKCGPFFNLEWTKYLGLMWRRQHSVLQCKPKASYFDDLLQLYKTLKEAKQP